MKDKYNPHTLKQCSRCNEEKEHRFFGRNKNCKGGIVPYCKMCRNAEAREWKRNNPDSVRASKQKYNGTARAHELWRESRLRRLDKIEAYQREYRANNHAKILATDRRKKLMDKFGITLEEYDAMLKAQDGVCACCKQPETAKYQKTGRLKSLAVDHCHVGGHNRALLCQRCNIIVGQSLESPGYLRIVAQWLDGIKQPRILEPAQGV